MGVAEASARVLSVAAGDLAALGYLAVGGSVLFEARSVFSAVALGDGNSGARRVLTERFTRERGGSASPPSHVVFTAEAPASGFPVTRFDKAGLGLVHT